MMKHTEDFKQEAVLIACEVGLRVVASYPVQGWIRIVIWR